MFRCLPRLNHNYGIYTQLQLKIPNACITISVFRYACSVVAIQSSLFFFLFFNDQMILAYKINGSKRLKTFYSPLIDIRKFLSKIPHSVTKIFFYNWSRNQVLGQEVVITCTYYQCVCHLVKNAYLKKLEHFQKIWYISPNKVI